MQMFAEARFVPFSGDGFAPGLAKGGEGIYSMPDGLEQD